MHNSKQHIPSNTSAGGITTGSAATGSAAAGRPADSAPLAYSNTLTSQGTPRLIVPDFARGMALWGIAAANATTAWFHNTEATTAAMFGGISDSHPMLDKIVAVFTAMFAHNRGLPMFSTLLGVGVGFIAMSLWRKQFPVGAARKTLVRRYAFLLLFGAVHTVFLFYGDIMTTYGICGILLALLLTMKDKHIKLIAYIMLGLSLVVSVLAAALIGFAAGENPAFAEEMSGSMNPAAALDTLPGGANLDSYPGLLATQAMVLVFTLLGMPFTTFVYFPVMLIGFVWAREGRFAKVAEYRKSFWAWTVAGAVFVFGIGLPWGLASIGVLPSQWEAVFTILNFGAGVITGPAILACCALLLDGAQQRINRATATSTTPAQAYVAATPLWLRIPAALGKRSMSGYLFQSLVFFVLVYPFTLNFGHNTGAAVQFGLATTIWLISLALAWALEVSNKPGPFEWLHRRISYGKTGRPQLKQARQGQAQVQGQAQARQGVPQAQGQAQGQAQAGSRRGVEGSRS